MRLQKGQQLRTPQLYLLPKIHKNINPIPGRPIVSANESPTERISAFVDHFLSPIFQTGRSYIRDTGDFLQKLEKVDNLTGDEILLTLDVSALYTNIPNEEGTMAALRALRIARPTNSQPSNLSLVELLAQVLSLNNFQFDGKNYLQVGGTAMGTTSPHMNSNHAPGIVTLMTSSASGSMVRMSWNDSQTT